MLDRTPPSPAEKKSLAKLPGGGKDPLARLVRRRAPLGALALLAAYAVPVLVVWLSGRAAAAGLLGGARWVPITVGVVLGLGLFAHQGFSTNVFAFATDVYPARSVGSAIGIAAFAGNLWSIGLIQFAAWSLANGLGYTPSMFICALSYLSALALLHLIVPRIRQTRRAQLQTCAAHRLDPLDRIHARLPEVGC